MPTQHHYMIVIRVANNAVTRVELDESDVPDYGYIYDEKRGTYGHRTEANAAHDDVARRRLRRMLDHHDVGRKLAEELVEMHREGAIELGSWPTALTFVEDYNLTLEEEA
jgi:hypothetical protein